MAALAGAKTFLATARTNLGGPRRSWQMPKRSWLQTRRFAGRQDKVHGDSSYPPRVTETVSTRKDGTETAPTRSSPGRRQAILGGRKDETAADGLGRRQNNLSVKRPKSETAHSRKGIGLS